MTSPSSVRWTISHPNVIHETIDGEVVAINFVTGAYYSLDKVGADIWALLEKSATVAQIVEVIDRRYDGGHASLEQVVVSLIDELRREGLVAADGTQETERVLETREREGTKLEKHKFEAPILRKYTDMEALISLDPIHQVDDTGWPNHDPEPARSS